MNGHGSARRTLVLTSTLPQYPGDPRGQFILRHWEQRASREHHVRILAPQTAWCRGELSTPCEIVRFAYAPRPLSTATGRYGILENIRERPWRMSLLPLLWLCARRALRSELGAFEPDVVVAHMFLPGGWIAARECRRRGVPFELYGHGTDVDMVLRLPVWLRTQFAHDVSWARVVRVPSAEKLGRVRASLSIAAPTVVEPMAHVVSSVSDAALPVRPPAADRTILYLGRLTRQKGVDDLLRAVSTLGAGYRLEIAGDGPQRRSLERLAVRLGVAARFHGFVDENDKPALWDIADVLCVPSRELPGGFSEGAPLVVREAFAAGVPVVATRVGGIPELCGQGGRAHLVGPNDPLALAEALAQACTGHERLRDAG